MKEHPRYNDLLEWVRVLNPSAASDNDGDQVLSFSLTKVVNDVANYTHVVIDELPEELDQTIIALCQQLIITHDLLTAPEEQAGNVSSMTEGDVSVSFKSPGETYATLLAVNSITDDYRAQLNAFRVVKR